MKLIQLLLVLAVAGYGYKTWTEHRAGSSAVATTASTSAPSTRGFVALPAMTGADASKVIVVAAENCPEDAAQRADRLASDLASNGVPVARTHNVSFDIPGNDQEVANRVVAVMNGELPIVFVRGRAKSNPTLEDVVAEYAAR